MTYCSPCQTFFTGTTSFDRHRVGSHWPVCERRCLDADEMTEAGMEPNSKGEWAIPATEAQKASLAALNAARTTPTAASITRSQTKKAKKQPVLPPKPQNSPLDPKSAPSTGAETGEKR